MSWHVNILDKLICWAIHAPLQQVATHFENLECGHTSVQREKVSAQVSKLKLTKWCKMKNENKGTLLPLRLWGLLVTKKGSGNFLRSVFTIDWHENKCTTHANWTCKHQFKNAHFHWVHTMHDKGQSWSSAFLFLRMKKKPYEQFRRQRFACCHTQEVQLARVRTTGASPGLNTFCD